jgi:hypothetical protein
MHAITFLSLLSLVGCSKSESALPFGGAADGTESSSDDTASSSTGSTDCGDEWTESDGVHIQPGTCLAWSPRSDDKMDWYSAVSEEDADRGGCGSDCPDPGSLGYCTIFDSMDGRSNWRIPSKEELKQASYEYPEFENVEGRLWSRDTGSGSTGNAWTVDLSRAGGWMEMTKDDEGNSVRCVSDG